MIKCPILIFHGSNDAVVPYQQALKLYQVIPLGLKKLFKIEGGGYNYHQDYDVFKKGMDEILN